MKNKLTIYILVAMALGIGVGWAVHNNASPAFQTSFAANIKLLATIFIRLVQMIIAPLVFSTLVVGIAKLGDLKAVGRVGGKALLWFVTASLISLLIGMLVVNAFKPGEGLNLGAVDAKAVEDVVGKTKSFSLQNFIEHIVPKSVIEAMATNEILQLVVFSIFFGIALAGLGEKGKTLIKALDTVAHVVLKMVGYVMAFAPLGVFGAIAAVIATRGLDILIVYGKYFGAFITGIALLWIVLLIAGFVFLRQRMPGLISRLLTPMVIAFSTTSSEAVFPKMTEELERFGCKDKIVSFILPLG
ncbi:MAG: cation:dicarboxylase symporter family transporter, partial [Chitinophagaceae bacterium]|nr:cation:dicarboxylase symporter family transporter [Chitinophagaceae bacterium]